MNSSETTKAKPPTGHGWWPAFAAIFVLLLSVVGITGPAEYVEQILLGWLYFPFRTIPQATVDWPTAVLGLICVVAFVAALHATARWMLRSTAWSKHESEQQWTWRCSWIASATLFVMFASGTALVGVTHQCIWLLSGRSTSESILAANSPGFITQARNTARTTRAKNDLRMFGVAFLNVASTSRSRLPPGGTMTESGELLHGWAAFLGPYHSYSTSEIDFGVPWHQPPNERIYKSQLRCFVNPSQPGPVFDANGYALNHWSGNVHVLPLQTLKPATDDTQTRHDVWNYPGVSFEEITDGMTNTVLLGSAGGDFKPWGHPANLRDPARGINNSPQNFGGPAQWKGVLFGFCDGSVKMMSNETDSGVLDALARPADGVPVNSL